MILEEPLIAAGFIQLGSVPLLVNFCSTDSNKHNCWARAVQLPKLFQRALAGRELCVLLDRFPGLHHKL